LGREGKTPSKALVSKKRIQPLLKGRFRTDSVRETLALAAKLGKTLEPGNVVALTGEIGSGKTVFIKGLSQGLGVKKGKGVKSPTFVLLHVYSGRVPVYHFDLYRLERERELEAIGFDEFLSTREIVCLVEWADRAVKRIPKQAVWVRMKVTGTSSREITIQQNENRSRL
jgi:tRNA threonylcarbamoyladenosine biosynthesis protein TsaE